MPIPPAAQQLIDQVEEIRSNVKVGTTGEADGIGVHRTITFDDKTGAWLAPILEAIDDERIAAVDGGEVTFVADTRSDHRQDYPIAEVDAVLNEPKKAAKKA